MSFVADRASASQLQATYLNAPFPKVGPSLSLILQPFVARILELPLPGRWECTRGEVPVWMTSMSLTLQELPSLHWDADRSPACSHAPVITSRRFTSASQFYFSPSKWSNGRALNDYFNENHNRSAEKWLFSLSLQPFVKWIPANNYTFQ